LRKGIFKIPMSVIKDNPKAVMAIMGKCVIVRAEYLYLLDAVEYHALCEEFKEVPKGCVIPRYKCLIIDSDSGEADISRFEEISGYE
jgi:hypothetical protein